MQFVRKIIDSTLIEKVIKLPGTLQNKKLEILIFPFDVAETDVYKNEFKPEDFAGILKLENPEKDIKSLRDEWERI